MKLEEKIKKIYNQCIENRKGQVADYIPALANVNEDLFGLSACTMDGYIHSFGDTKVEFCLQSTSKPLNYLVCCELNKSEFVHRYVGYEPSGQSFNSHVLNDHGLPHNPFLNAGAIVVSKLISDHKKEAAEKLELVINYYTKLSGNIGKVGYDPVVFLSEKEHADRNMSLAYFMREKGAFGEQKPSHNEIIEALDLYFRCCTLTINTDMGSVIAATLANGGICPVSKERVFSEESVKNCLTLMLSCGMYNYSGQFLFEVGLPAKSGVSGAILLVIPNKMGVCIYSPRLDENGNSERGLQVCKMLSKDLNEHIVHRIIHDKSKVEEKNKISREVYQQRFMTAASNGELENCKKVIKDLDLKEKDKVEFVNESDYNKRTALHLAAAEGRIQIVKYLIQEGAKVDIKDNWGATPLTDAQKENRQNVIKYLEETSQSDRETRV